MNTTTSQIQQNYQETIACVAKELWEKGGRQPNRDLDYWLEAEKHVRAQQQSVAVVANSGNPKSLAPFSKPVANVRSARAVTPKQSRRTRESQLTDQRRAAALF